MLPCATPVGSAGEQPTVPGRFPASATGARIPTIGPMASWWQRDIVDGGRLALLVCFAAFVVTFLVTRIVTRMIRADRGPFKNNVSSGGLHVHHAVPGIILLVAGAFTAVAADTDSAWSVVAGLLVGVGTSLVLDEFALILHLQDVYWAEEGRISVEMVSLAVGCLGLVLVGFNPFDVSDEAEAGSTIAATVAAVAVHLVWVLVCVAKGKYRFALFGAFLPILPVIGAFRLARPGSRWARRRYGPDKAARAEARAARSDARFGPATAWVGDFIAGKPSEPTVPQGIQAGAPPPAPDATPSKVPPATRR
jgi:hypothetical protein